MCEHYILGDFEVKNVDELKIEEQCKVLFSSNQGAPIKFVPRKNEKVDQEIKNIIKDMNITIPIIWVKKSMYLVGNKIISIEKKGEYVTAHIGGGYSKLTEYLLENHYKIEKDLIYKMI